MTNPEAQAHLMPAPEAADLDGSNYARVAATAVALTAALSTAAYETPAQAQAPTIPGSPNTYSQPPTMSDQVRVCTANASTYPVIKAGFVTKDGVRTRKLSVGLEDVKAFPIWPAQSCEGITSQSFGIKARVESDRNPDTGRTRMLAGSVKYVLNPTNEDFERGTYQKRFRLALNKAYKCEPGAGKRNIELDTVEKVTPSNNTAPAVFKRRLSAKKLGIKLC